MFMYFLPPPIVIGCVNDAPAPVLDIVSGADVTTEVSVVGKPPSAGVPLTAGAVVELTTDVSSVGNPGCALPLGAGDSVPAMGEGSGFCGSPDSPVRFAFSNAACRSFTCCCNALTVSVRDCTCWRSASTSAAVAGVVFETAGDGDELEAGGASCAKTVASGKIASVTKTIFFIQNS